MRVIEIEMRAGRIVIGQGGTPGACNKGVTFRHRRHSSLCRRPKVPMHPLWSAAKLKIEFPVDPMSVQYLPDIGIERSAALLGKMEVLICVRNRYLVVTRNLPVVTELTADLLAIDVTRGVIEEIVKGVSRRHGHGTARRK